MKLNHEKPQPDVEVIGLVKSRSVRFGTVHHDIDICYVDDEGNWHARLAGEFQGKRELLDVITWAPIPEELHVERL